METASKVMYTIANIFNWILAICCIGGIVVSSLVIAHVIPNETGYAYIGLGSLIYLIILLVIVLVTIGLVRIAKNKKSSKGWDILFLIIGVIEWNIFYILGGIFGIVAIRR